VAVGDRELRKHPAKHGSLGDRRVLARHAPKRLPISARASHVWTMSNDLRPDEWSIVKIFELGSTPPARPNDHLAQEARERLTPAMDRLPSPHEPFH